MATSATYAPAFSELLSALAPGTPMTLNGGAVGPEAVTSAWGTEYASRWLEDAKTSPYAQEINTLATLGGVFGDENGSFMPEKALTRAELVTLVNQAMGYWCWETQSEPPFSDISAEDWYASAVKIAYHMGLIQGDENGQFNPEATIDHQQFITILIRMGSQTDLSVESRLEQVTAEELAHSDVARFAPWARESAVAAAGLGLLTESLAELDPNAPTTREEAAAMVYNLMAYTGILLPVGETGQ